MCGRNMYDLENEHANYIACRVAIRLVYMQGDVTPCKPVEGYVIHHRLDNIPRPVFR